MYLYVIQYDQTSKSIFEPNKFSHLPYLDMEATTALTESFEWQNGGQNREPHDHWVHILTTIGFSIKSCGAKFPISC